MDFLTTSIRYKSGYKYQLHADHYHVLDFSTGDFVGNDYIKLDPTGEMRIIRGYAWDGPSGLSIDTANFMRGSLVHDALYQLMRENLLDNLAYRELADKTLRQICVTDGMSRLRSWYVYHAVRLFGDPFADPARNRPLIIAP